MAETPIWQAVCGLLDSAGGCAARIRISRMGLGLSYARMCEVAGGPGGPENARKWWSEMHTSAAGNDALRA